MIAMNDKQQLVVKKIAKLYDYITNNRVQFERHISYMNSDRLEAAGATPELTDYIFGKGVCRADSLGSLFRAVFSLSQQKEWRDLFESLSVGAQKAGHSVLVFKKLKPYQQIQFLLNYAAVNKLAETALLQKANTRSAIVR